MNPLRFVPSTADLFTAARGTSMLMRVRWRMVRGASARVGVGIGAIFLFLIVFASANLGEMIRNTAEQATDNSASVAAINYILSLERGQIGTFGAVALGSVIATAIFSPLIGVSGSTLFPAPELVGIRPHRLHRYFDTLVAQTVSVVGVFQLITLTALGSLLTLDGDRGPGFLIAWAMWPMVIALSAMVSWIIELSQRLYGRVARWATATLLTVVSGIAIWLDPAHGQTLFGAGDLFASAIRRATLGHWTAALPVFTGTALLTGAFVIAGATFTQAALSKPAVPTAAPRLFWRWTISANPVFALTQLLLLQVVRTGAIRRPILAVAIAAPPAVILTHGAFTVLNTLVITIPLAVALAWGVNIFGVIGPGMTWLAAQPNVGRMLLGVAIAVQLIIIAILGVGVWGPALLFGAVDLRTAASVAAGTLATTLVTTRSAAAKSVRRPYHVNMGQRGDQIIPPLTSVNYTLRFVAGGGQIGLVILSVQFRSIQLAILAGVAIWTSYRFIRLARYWADRSVQARVVTCVAA